MLMRGNVMRCEGELAYVRTIGEEEEGVARGSDPAGLVIFGDIISWQALAFEVSFGVEAGVTGANAKHFRALIHILACPLICSQPES